MLLSYYKAFQIEYHEMSYLQIYFTSLQKYFESDPMVITQNGTTTVFSPRAGFYGHILRAGQQAGRCIALGGFQVEGHDGC